MLHSAAKMPGRPPKALPPRLSGDALEEHVNRLRLEVEAEEARLAAEKKGMKDPLTIEEFMQLTGYSRQTAMLKIRRREIRSLVVRAGKTSARKRRMVEMPTDWNKEH
jgi:hypothetical protein